MALFKNNRPQLSPRDMCLKRYNAATSSLLLVVILTVVNIALVLAGQDTYFLFSASIPFFLVARGAILCGVLPDKFYIEYLGANPEELNFYSSSYLYGMIAIAALFIVFYLVAWLFARKGKVAFLIAALAVFVVDTVSPFVFFESDISTGAMDLVIHALVIAELALGIVSYFKLKKMPVEVVVEAPVEEAPTEEQ